MTSYEQELINRLKAELHEVQQQLVDYRVVSPGETKELLDDGWRVTYTIRCDHCYGNGCTHCHGVGAVVTLLKEGSTRFGAMVPSPGRVGAGCVLGFSGMKLSFMAQGRSGNATLAFHYKQLYSLLEALIRCLASPGRSFGLGHYGIEAEFRGPPALQLATLTRDRITVAVFPDERQRAALELLRANGFEAEANLLATAFEHEIFRGDHDAAAAARAAVGEIKPGTILQRTGGSAVVQSEGGDAETHRSVTMPVPMPMCSGVKLIEGLLKSLQGDVSQEGLHRVLSVVRDLITDWCWSYRAMEDQLSLALRQVDELNAQVKTLREELRQSQGRLYEVLRRQVEESAEGA